MENDPLPKFVCYLCVAKLENFQNFRDECLSVEQILKEYLPLVKRKSTDSRENEVRFVVFHFNSRKIIIHP